MPVVSMNLEMLVDEVGADGAVARSMADAPEIDGVVRIADGRGLRAGQFAEVVVTGASEHDLQARLAADHAAPAKVGS